MSGAVWAKVNRWALGRRRRADVVALGDSNTLVSYLPPWSGDRWTALVARRLGVRVANLGRDGATLRAAIDGGLVDRALAMRPGVVLVAFGVNDAKVMSPEAFAADLRAVVAQAQSAGVRVALLTTVWVDHPAHFSVDRNAALDPVNDATRRVAAECGAELVDIAARTRAEVEAGQWDLRLRAEGAAPGKESDNIHFNRAGCRVVADAVVQALSTSGSGETYSTR